MTVTHYPSLESLACDDVRNPSWWASVARSLDELDVRLQSDAAADEGPSGAFADAVSRDPSLANDARRLLDDHRRLTERARRLRRLVATVAGDERQISAVAGELSALATAEQRYQQRSRSLYWDSFARDLGGER